MGAELLKDRIREALADAGRTQTELAAACKVSAPSVNDWLSGKTKSLKAATAQRAAAYLGVSMLWLTEGKGAKRPAAGFAPSLESLQDAADLSIEAQIETLRRTITGIAREFGVDAFDLVSDSPGARERVARALRRIPKRAEPSSMNDDVLDSDYSFDRTGVDLPRALPTLHVHEREGVSFASSHDLDKYAQDNAAPGQVGPSRKDRRAR